VGGFKPMAPPAAPVMASRSISIVSKSFVVMIVIRSAARRRIHHVADLLADPRSGIPQAAAERATDVRAKALAGDTTGTRGGRLADGRQRSRERSATGRTTRTTGDAAGEVADLAVDAAARAVVVTTTTGDEVERSGVDGHELGGHVVILFSALVSFVVSIRA
jgi:hypothetical protein